MTTWEYLFVSRSGDTCYRWWSGASEPLTFSGRDFMRELRLIGEEGWELVAVVLEDGLWWYHFKRPSKEG